MDRQTGVSGLVDQMTGRLAALEDSLSFAVLPNARQPVALAGSVEGRLGERTVSECAESRSSQPRRVSNTAPFGGG